VFAPEKSLRLCPPGTSGLSQGRKLSALETDPRSDRLPVRRSSGAWNEAGKARTISLIDSFIGQDPHTPRDTGATARFWAGLFYRDLGLKPQA